MNSWKATHHLYKSDAWWTVDEGDEDGPFLRRIVDCGQDETLARRIAKLPELEATDEKLPKTKDRVSVVPGEDVVWHPNVRSNVSGEIQPMAVDVDGGAVWSRTLERRLVSECYSTPEAAELIGKTGCPGCGADQEESTHGAGYFRWSCGSNTGPAGFGRSQVCWERNETAKRKIDSPHLAMDLVRRDIVKQRDNQKENETCD